MKVNDFRGELTGDSAKKEALVSRRTECICFQNELKYLDILWTKIKWFLLENLDTLIQ